MGRYLIVGGGVGGMSTAIAMGRLGMEIDLVDVDPNWRVYGAGITITGPSLRAFRDLGVLEEIRALGYTADGTRVCNQRGELLFDIDTPRLDGDVPGGGGILRPVLHNILSAKTRTSGANIRLGVTVETLVQTPDRVEVIFTDGSAGEYELVVAADGLFSAMRGRLFEDAPQPEFINQVCWRMRAPRAPAVDRRHYFLGGPVKVGLNPVAPDEMYLFLLETVDRKLRPGPDELRVGLRRLLEDYGGVLSEVRAGITDHVEIIYRPLETFKLPGPWFVGRTLLIGDAAHPTMPQLASGAGLAAEDGLVLADELRRAASVPEALDGFMRRRRRRCEMAMANALEISWRERTRQPLETQAAIVERSLHALAEPI